MQLLNHTLQGGPDVWGNATYAPDDRDDFTHKHTYGQLISFRNDSIEAQNLTAAEAGNWILERTPVSFQVRQNQVIRVN